MTEITEGLHLGECLELMKRIPDRIVDMILCDLPYGTTACSWDAVIPFEQLWPHYRRLISDNGAIILTANQPLLPLWCHRLTTFSNINGCGSKIVQQVRNIPKIVRWVNMKMFWFFLKPLWVTLLN